MLWDETPWTWVVLTDGVYQPAAPIFGGVNVLAIRADARFGSGHRYEGGGIYRIPFCVVDTERLSYMRE